MLVPPVTVSATNFSGTVRCEATYPHRYVAPGDLTEVSMSITNLSDRPRSLTREAWLRFRDVDGRLLADASFGYTGVRPREFRFA